jgi:hypothetical protein
MVKKYTAANISNRLLLSTICYPATRPSKLLDGYQGHPLFLPVAWDRPAAMEPGSEMVYTRHYLFTQHL